MTVVYLCGALVVLTLVTWAALQGGIMGAAARAVFGLLTAIVTIVVVVAAVFLAIIMLGLGRAPFDFGGVVLVAAARMGVLVFGPLAVVAWLVMSRATARARRRATLQPEAARAPAKLTGVRPMLAVLAAAVAIAAWAAWNRDAHDHEIFAVRFVDGGQALYSIDRWNVLKIWRHEQSGPADAAYRERASMKLPIDFVAVDMRVSRDGRHLALLDHYKGVTVVHVDEAGRHAEIVGIFARSTMMTERNGEFVLAGYDGIDWVVPGEKEPRRKLRWSRQITAIEAGARGVAVAESGGRVWLIEDAQEAPREIGGGDFQLSEIALTSDGRSLVTLRGVGPGMVYDLDADARHPLEIRSSFARPLAGSLVVSCDGRSGRCQTIDGRSGSVGKPFETAVQAFRSGDAVPGAVALALGGQLAVVTLSAEGVPERQAFLR